MTMTMTTTTITATHDNADYLQAIKACQLSFVLAFLTLPDSCQPCGWTSEREPAWPGQVKTLPPSNWYLLPNQYLIIVQALNLTRRSRSILSSAKMLSPKFGVPFGAAKLLDASSAYDFPSQPASTAPLQSPNTSSLEAIVYLKS